jgi:hypothetical protein
MMGPSHSLSGAMVGLAGVGIYNSVISPTHPLEIANAIMVVIVTAGAALLPDIDSRSAIAVRSFGIFGLLVHKLVNGLSIVVYNLTKTKYDKDIEGGHRTLFHTGLVAIMMGVMTVLLCLPTWPIQLWGHSSTFGQLMAIIITAIFMNLMIAGLFDKALKSAKAKYGPYIFMAISIGLTITLSFFLPPVESVDGVVTSTGLTSYSWLGIAVTLGYFVHIWGDFITKMGVPSWPIKIAGKRWYGLALPTPLRIQAGGTFEYAVLVPLFSIATVGLLVWNIFIYVSILAGM